MEPKREHGDDRVMWQIRPEEAPGCYGPWAICETGADCIDMIDGGDIGSRYQVQMRVVTAEEWNAMPEFDGW